MRKIRLNVCPLHRHAPKPQIRYIMAIFKLLKTTTATDLDMMFDGCQYNTIDHATDIELYMDGCVAIISLAEVKLV